MIPSFHMIVAMDAKNGIGKNGGLPWHLPADLNHFRDITVGEQSDSRMNVVMMGRKTWDSLPEKFRPLPKRLNIVLTRSPEGNFPSNVLEASGFEQAFSLLETPVICGIRGDVFIIGGAQIFAIALGYPQCQKIYATHIEKIYDCDTFFPEFAHQFNLTQSSPIFQENSLSYRFAEYTRK
ncbi:MAG: dihydrofolate reductase [Candidatus Omnitrophota bacterium]|nr:dihydrofolate reductase [Candidatus Omnitrophota bacterium]